MSAIRAGQIATGLLACVTARLTALQRPVRHASVYHGRQPPPMEHCDCHHRPGSPPGRGHAWARVAQIDAEASTKQLDVRTWWATIQLGIYRCVPMTDDGAPQDLAEQTAQANALLVDASALIHVVECCAAVEDRRVKVQPWTPVGPSGGCAGGTMTLYVEL
ncbi:hypothetical protein ACQEVF_57120 [Nonomuraea polychroma]|uniref:hypothetical protein n=1 Tax=Nonomuraea polychroma TaxID=46176 RepID=UPI003D91286A